MRTGGIEDQGDIDEVRFVVLEQIDREFKNPASAGWDQVEFTRALAKVKM